MSPEFKLGSVSNYFNPSDENSIFRLDADDNLSGDTKEKKRIEIIVEDLEKKIETKKNQREQLLDQLNLEDVKIDQYDRLIIGIDEQVQPLLDPINTQINAVKAAYDARVGAGCSNSLKWVVIGFGEDDDGDQLITYQCQRNALQLVQRRPRLDNSIEIVKTGTTDPGTIVTGYYGYKFYRKPINRDYGANLIDVFTGSVSTGSTILEVEQTEFDDSAGDDGLDFVIGDEITDSIESPTLFPLGKLPEIVGIGSTATFSGITTTIQGSISVGSTVLSLVGFGTVDTGNVLVRLNTVFHQFQSTAADFGAKVGSGIGRTGVLSIDTKVIAIGTGTTSYEFYDADFNSGIGSIRTRTENVMTLVLSSPAIATTSLGIFNVGVVSFTPSLILSEAATGNGSDTQFSIIRPAKDPDKDFDFEKNPIDPITIGLIGNDNLGLGHTALIINNAEPSRTVGWHQVRNYSHRQPNGEIRVYELEPEQGAGRAVYHKGNLAWPIVVTDDGDGGTDERYANEGEILMVGADGSNSIIISDPDDEDGVGSGSSKNVGTTNVSPGPQTPGNSQCVTLANNIATEEAALITITNQNLPKANRLAAQSRALRELRDDMELDAYGLLQASAATRKEIDRLTVLLNELKDQQLESYG